MRATNKSISESVNESESLSLLYFRQSESI